MTRKKKWSIVDNVLMEWKNECCHLSKKKMMDVVVVVAGKKDCCMAAAAAAVDDDTSFLKDHSMTMVHMDEILTSSSSFPWYPNTIPHYFHLPS